MPRAARARGAAGEWLLAAAIAAAVFVLFHFQGNASSVAMEGRSVFLWLWRQWTHPGGDFSHVWLMPLISLGLVLRQARELRAAPKAASRAGLALTALLVLLHVAAVRAQQPRVSALALAGLTWSIPLALYGWPAARRLLFPCAYLALAVASYFLVSLTFQLRLFASAISAGTLNGIGIAARRNGTAIYSAAGGGFHFDVADPCSGLRSLVVMTALAAPYAWLTQKTPAKKWLLFALAVPLAVLANTARIVTVALVAQWFGRESAIKTYHDYSGYIVFVVAVLLLLGADRLINVNYRERWRQWQQRAAKPAS